MFLTFDSSIQLLSISSAGVLMVAIGFDEGQTTTWHIIHFYIKFKAIFSSMKVTGNVGPLKHLIKAPGILTIYVFSSGSGGRQSRPYWH